MRGGRLALPYGIRSEEHILFARTATRTDTNDGQQLGLDAVYGKGKYRAELMGIAGNTQIGPDDYRERGYSALFAYAPKNTFEVGVSSMVTHANLDVDYQEERTRQAHGVFARYAPIERVRFLAGPTSRDRRWPPTQPRPVPSATCKSTPSRRRAST